MKITMKALITLMLAALTVTALLTGCSGTEDPSSAPDQPASATTAPAATTAPVPTDVSGDGWSIQGTFWQNEETDEILILKEDLSALWSNPVGGEAQFGRYEWNPDNNRGRLFIDDWDVEMEMTGRGLRIFNDVRNDTYSQLEKLPDGYKEAEKPQ